MLHAQTPFPPCRSYFLVWPSSTSFWNALHWAQLYNEPEPHLRAFNYGPEYDLGLVKSPTVFLTGGTDVLAPPQSFDEAAKHLGASLVETHQIQGYSHMVILSEIYMPGDACIFISLWLALHCAFEKQANLPFVTHCLN